MELSSEYAGFLKTRSTDNEDPGLGCTTEYDGSSRGQATVYEYDRGLSGLPDGPMSSNVRQEFESAISNVFMVEQALGAEVELADKYATGTPETGPEFLCAEFVIRDETGARRSRLYLTAAAGKFVKVRVTLAGNDPTDPTARHFADAVAADLPRTKFYALGTVANATLTVDRRFDVLGLVSIALPGPWSWHTEDMDNPGAKGAIFRCIEEGGDEGLAYVLVADLSDDPDEPDVSLLEVKDIAELDRFLEPEVRKVMAREGREMVKWMSSHLDETAEPKRVVTAYIGRDIGKERQYIDVRMNARGRRVVVAGCFNVDRADDLAVPVFSALQDAVVLDDSQ